MLDRVQDAPGLTAHAPACEHAPVAHFQARRRAKGALVDDISDKPWFWALSILLCIGSTIWLLNHGVPWWLFFFLR